MDLEPELPVVPEGVTGGRTAGWWGMLMVIFTDGALFTLFLASYFFLRFRSGPTWPPDGIPEPTVLFFSIMTGLLALAAITMQWADFALRKGRRVRFWIGTICTIVLGLGFLGLQAVEFLSEKTYFTPRTDAYGSIFYLTETVHAAHVVVGVLLLGWLLWSTRNITAPGRTSTVQIIGLYWYFLLIVAIAILLSFYLHPRFWS
jgi:heme/copper-type cytochrome/quinol oxidase subunit 3